MTAARALRWLALVAGAAAAYGAVAPNAEIAARPAAEEVVELPPLGDRAHMLRAALIGMQAGKAQEGRGLHHAHQ